MIFYFLKRALGSIIYIKVLKSFFLYVEQVFCVNFIRYIHFYFMFIILQYESIGLLNSKRPLREDIEKQQNRCMDDNETNSLTIFLYHIFCLDLWVSSMVKRDIVLGMVDYVRDVLIACNYSPELADLPLRVILIYSYIFIFKQKYF